MNKRAYVLWELLLVLAILSILARLVVLSGKSLDYQYGQIEIKRLVQDLSLARNKSNRSNEEYQIHIDSQTNSYTLILNDKKLKRELKSSLKLVSTNFDRGRINFVNGGISKGGTIVLRLDGKNIKLAISPVYPSINIYYEE